MKKKIKIFITGFVIVSFFYAVSLYFLDTGIQGYKKYQKDIHLMPQVDKMNIIRFEKLNALWEGNILDEKDIHYSAVGISMYMVPPDMVIFNSDFNSGTAIRGEFNESWILNIDEIIMNFSAIFDTGGLSSFPAVLIILGGLFCALFGYSFFYFIPRIKKEKWKRHFFLRIGAGILLIIILDALLFGLCFWMCTSHQLLIPLKPILFIFVLTIVMHNSAFCFGSLFSPHMEKIYAIILLLVIAILYMSSALFEFNIDRKISDLNINISKRELQKLTISSDLYKKLTDEGENFGYGNVVNEKIKKIVLKYREKDYPRIDLIEKATIDEEIMISNHYNKYVVFFPFHLFFKIINDLSGENIDNKIKFHKYLIEKKKEYVNNVIDKVYLSNSKPKEQFFNEKELFFKAESHIPNSILKKGLLINLLCTLLLIFTSAFLFKYRVRKIEEDEKEKRNEKKKMG